MHFFPSYIFAINTYLCTHVFQCIVLVDYYAPLFFLEVTSIEAQDFCRKVNLCGEFISMSQALPKDTCELCHTVVTEALLKLKDPDTEVAF